MRGKDQVHSFLKRWTCIGLCVVTAGTVLCAACGGGGGGKTTPAATGTAIVTPAAKTVATSASTKPSSTPTQAAAATASGDAGQGATVTLVTKNTAFDKSELTAKPGEVTIVMDNQDLGIAHNLHVFKGTDSKGQDLGKTDVAAGPVTQTLKLNLTAGDYFLVCDVHPTTAFANLKVE
jgi:plastocyanin